MVAEDDQYIAQKAEVLESFRHGISLFEFWSNGIVYIGIKDDAELQIEDSRWQYDLLSSRYDGRNGLRVLVEPGPNTSITKEAREFASEPERGELSKGTAVLVKSLAHRLVINFIIKLAYRKTMKMRMFDNKEKAIAWLLSL
jgi:hypothetical protein